LCALEHSTENASLGAGIVVAVLAGGADEELPGATRLNVERDRVCLNGVSALQVAELEELVMKEA
jgi:hypothetical protein